MNTQLNTIFSKLQVKSTVLYIVMLIIILSGSMVKVFIDVQQEKDFLHQAIKNSQALLQYKIASKEIKKTIDEVRNSGLELYKFTHSSVYFLNDKGTPLYWIENADESNILEKHSKNKVSSILLGRFKKNRFKEKEIYKGYFISRVNVSESNDRSIALVINQYELWLQQSINTFPLALLSIILFSIFYFSINSSNKNWVYKPVGKLMKHLEFEAQGISSELSREVPEDWQNIFMELELSRNNNNTLLAPETEEEVTQRYHAQLEELRWAKQQLEKYQSKDIEHASPTQSHIITEAFENSTIGIMVTDQDSIPIFVNNKAKEILGKGIKPETEEDLLDVRKIYIEGTDAEIPSEQHPMILTKQTGQPQLSKHIEVYNPNTGFRNGVSICSVKIDDGVVVSFVVLK
ncbi:hypothetical protein [Flammeovirga sp. SubArs3]|uniref:hypothetical protein n=1 Tax=Flammeovirga sp. SubArs3 TaxID=2995316 RepID=UPI00248C14C7|nr:hypothetical protein [Flammeovirga sp. SubArs3]